MRCDSLRSGFATITRNRWVYPVISIDAIVLKVRSGSVANGPVYVAIGINLKGRRDVLGLVGWRRGRFMGAGQDVPAVGPVLLRRAHASATRRVRQALPADRL